jgi:protein-S-isoprenylcysteine O-methyltransferase Ste14
MKHPMYLGEWMAAVGMAGLAAGFWNAAAVGLVAELLLREWAIREEA